MDYSKLSDFEINKRVAEVLEILDYTVEDKGVRVRVNAGPMVVPCPFDPCNNPSDALPIIVENEIGITFGTEQGSAVAVVGKDFYQHVESKNKLLRAAMVVFLMMKEKQD
ncbi:phage protein NinX family protein [Pontibacter sp. JAM-7]|uniref:phage protein NinX family protein n=1 Tax=Pontibacter sp. JAM-7 TaxID=3366581 RepID=UPI003AF4C36C